jgi:hypothetical protein
VSQSRHALRYAQRGWSVFPCADKRPLTRQGFKDASVNPDRITSWWSRWPDATIGVVCGEHLTVLDVDSHTGMRELRSLANQHDLKLSSVPQVRTPRGRHYWFAGNGLPRRLRLLPDIDLLGHGGYVIAPPAPDRAWTRRPLGPLPEMPPTFHDRLVELTSRAWTGDHALGGGIMEGMRNSTMTKMAGAMRRQGMSEPAILAALQIENAARCAPPLPDAEVVTIIRSIMRYPQEARSWVAPPTVTSGAKLLHHYLSARSGGTGEVWWLTEQQMADDLACSDRSIRKWSQELVAGKLLTITPRPRTTNHYTLLSLSTKN